MDYSQNDHAHKNAASMRMIRTLRELQKDDLPTAGGKAANLGELIRAGFPVPGGFVLTTMAYDLLLEGGLKGVIRQAFAEDGGGANIREAIYDIPFPRQVRQAVLEAYDSLGAGPVAVRSSATAEDLPGAAFAGQQDTFLNVVGGEQVLDAVRGCWASLWSERAVTYRQRQGIRQAGVKMAVVVQHMVSAEVAGVMFTAHPVTGEREEVVVDAGPGLGEAVVSGRTTPDHFVLRKRWWGWKVKSRKAGQHEVVIRAREGGGTEAVEGRTARDKTVLTDRVLRNLASTGSEIEALFGSPQDIEWARAGDQLHILQSRPMTGLPGLPPRANRIVRGLAAIIAEVLPRRPYPLEATTWGPELLLDTVLAPFIERIGVSVPPVEKMLAEEDGVITRFTGEIPIKVTPTVLLAPVRVLQLAMRYDPAQWREDPVLEQALSQIESMEARDVKTLSWAELIKTVQRIQETADFVGELRMHYAPRAVLAAAGLRLWLGLLGKGDHFSQLVFTGVETKVVAANRRLEEMAANIREDPALMELFEGHEPDEIRDALKKTASGKAFLRKLEAFLDEYGHREAGGTLLLSEGTWRDHPQVVLGILQGLAGMKARSTPDQENWQEARDEVLDHPLMGWTPLRSHFLCLLEGARRLQALREDTRFYFMRPLPVLRRTVLECGRRLCEAGVLARREDVYHLKLGELEDLTGMWPLPPGKKRDLQGVVYRRKAKRAALEGQPLVDPRYYQQAKSGREDVLLQGTPGSPGGAVGIVRVIREEREFPKLRAGDVLVAPYTNPAWTPLFQRAAAVVVDTGGPASHAAIVAREYGIPAVMGTGDGTRRLADGQRVQVDGSQGWVKAVGEPGEHLTAK